MSRVGVVCEVARAQHEHGKKLMETYMKRSRESADRIPQHDYALALQSAVSWMGDRYLLAEPVSRRAEERKAFFVVQPSWHDAQRIRLPVNRKH
jgi:hypothetical protein